MQSIRSPLSTAQHMVLQIFEDGVWDSLLNILKMTVLSLFEKEVFFLSLK